MSNLETPGRAARTVTVAAVLLVAGVAGIVSFVHMATLAREAGEGWRALLLPLSVDGLVVAASMVLVTRRRAGLPGGWLAWAALLGGVGASLAANIAAAEATTTARLIAGWPALAFAVAFELLLQQRRVAAVEPVELARPVPDQTGPAPSWEDRTRTTPSSTDLDLAAELAVIAAAEVRRSGQVDQPRPVTDQSAEPQAREPTTGVLPSIRDEDLIPLIREWIAEEGSAPSRERVRTRYGIGSKRADRVRTLAMIPNQQSDRGSDQQSTNGHGPDHRGSTGRDGDGR